MIDWDALWTWLKGERQTAIEDKRALSEAAKEILENKAFTSVLIQRMGEIVGAISADNLTPDKVMELRAELRMIQELPARLNGLIKAYKEALKHKAAA